MIRNDAKELNRSTRALCILTALGLVTACTWLAVGAENTVQSDGEGVKIEVRAQRFIVVDKAGTERARLGILENGEAGMTIGNKEKTASVSIALDRFGGPRITLMNGKGEELFALGIMKDKHPVLVMSDEQGTRRLVMIVGSGGAVTIELNDTKQKGRCTIALAETGEPKILLKDNQERVRASLTLLDSGTVALDLWDRNGRARVVFQINPEDIADAAVFGADGLPIWSAGTP